MLINHIKKEKIYQNSDFEFCLFWYVIGLYFCVFFQLTKIEFFQSCMGGGGEIRKKCNFTEKLTFKRQENISVEEV